MDVVWHPGCFRCYACDQPIIGYDVPTEYWVLPIWMQNTCASHQHDGTHYCFSCHRMEKSKQPKISILMLKGFPRITAGSTLAHEMMHAWLRLNGYGMLDPQVEEGICSVMSYLWLDSEMMSGSDTNVASTSSSSSSTSYRKSQRSQFERKLAEYCKYYLKNREIPLYGDGFREGYAVVLKYGLKCVLDHIKLKGRFPC